MSKSKEELDRMAVGELRMLAARMALLASFRAEYGHPLKEGRKEELTAAILKAQEAGVSTSGAGVSVQISGSDALAQGLAQAIASSDMFDALVSARVEGFLATLGPRTLVVADPRRPGVELPPVPNDAILARAIRFAAARRPFMLVGPAGSGKSWRVERVAEALALEFYQGNFSAGTSESMLLGRMDARGVFHSTPFLHAFEHGGVYLADDVDRIGDPAVLSCLHNALAGHTDRLSVPNRADAPFAQRHVDFVFAATCNSVHGADEFYTAANALDAAFLDRFAQRILFVDYDTEFERGVAAQAGDSGREFYQWMRACRSALAKAGVRRFLSTRTLMAACENLADDSTVTAEKAAALMLFTEDEKATVSTC